MHLLKKYIIIYIHQENFAFSQEHLKWMMLHLLLLIAGYCSCILGKYISIFCSLHCSMYLIVLKWVFLQKDYFTTLNNVRFGGESVHVYATGTGSFSPQILKKNSSLCVDWNWLQNEMLIYQCIHNNLEEAITTSVLLEI